MLSIHKRYHFWILPVGQASVRPAYWSSQHIPHPLSTIDCFALSADAPTYSHLRRCTLTITSSDPSQLAVSSVSLSMCANSSYQNRQFHCLRNIWLTFSPVSELLSTLHYSTCNHVLTEHVFTCWVAKLSYPLEENIYFFHPDIWQQG